MKIKESSYLTIKFFGRVHSEQWFPNFISSRTICGSRTASTYHLVPGKLYLPNIIRWKVWKTRIDTIWTWMQQLWEIIMPIFTSTMEVHKNSRIY